MTIKPALTAEEWQRWFASRTTVPSPLKELANQDYHMLAALILYGQPFGFTREDVALLRSAWAISPFMFPGLMGEKLRSQMAHFESLADRIESLLPPEEP